MPRIARKAVDGGVYHILNRGNGRQRVFHKDADYLKFVSLLKDVQERFAIRLFAYCLMPNHFHLLVKAEQGEDLSLGMHWFTTTYVRRHHRHYRTSGHLWQGRYKSFSIEDDEQLLTVVRYIEGNPVRANLVESAAGWVWSSHRERCDLLGTSRGLAPQEPVPDNEQRLIVDLPITLPELWTEFVDTPLTGKELGRVKKKIERQAKVAG